MPTNEERREVAENLRTMTMLGCRYKEEFYDLLNETVMNEWDFHSFSDVADRLADLIEPEPINGETSDGYHTFNELYHHRALLFSVVVRNYPELCWKSKKHHTGDMYEGMFIVGINTPDGQASYHYDIEPYWDMFKCEELEFAPEWDGHTPDQAIERIGRLTRHEPEPERTCYIDKRVPDAPFCSRCAYDWNDDWCHCPNCGCKAEH